MAYYPDLAPCRYFSRGNTIAVGWLDADHAFPTGTLAPERYQLLVDSFERGRWFQPTSFPGFHICELCDAGKGGSDNLFVPDGDRCLVVPVLILHYIRDHAYLPPDELFIALEKCPPFGSEAYLAATSWR